MLKDAKKSDTRPYSFITACSILPKKSSGLEMVRRPLMISGSFETAIPKEFQTRVRNALSQESYGEYDLRTLRIYGEINFPAFESLVVDLPDLFEEDLNIGSDK